MEECYRPPCEYAHKMSHVSFQLTLPKYVYREMIAMPRHFVTIYNQIICEILSCMQLLVASVHHDS